MNAAQHSSTPRLLCITPFGRPVVPEVYWISAGACGSIATAASQWSSASRLASSERNQSNSGRNTLGEAAMPCTASRIAAACAGSPYRATGSQSARICRSEAPSSRELSAAGNAPTARAAKKITARLGPSSSAITTRSPGATRSRSICAAWRRTARSNSR